MAVIFFFFPSPISFLHPFTFFFFFAGRAVEPEVVKRNYVAPEPEPGSAYIVPQAPTGTEFDPTMREERKKARKRK